MLLTHKGSLDAVNGTKQNGEVRGSTCSHRYVSERLSNCPHPRLYNWQGGMEKLSKLYQNSGFGNKMHLTEDLMTVKMDGEGKIQTHIEKLEAIDAPITGDQ